MKINIINETKYKLNKTEFKKHILKVCKNLNLKNYEINYRFTTDIVITDYNKKYFNSDKATDVIAFPDGVTKISDLITFLGDIIISLDTVESNSKIYKCNFFEELLRVMIHGLLHLTGYKDNNPVNKKEMFDKQEKLLAYAAM